MPPSPVVVLVPTSVAASPSASLTLADRLPKLMPAIVIGVERAGIVEAFGRHAPAIPLFEVDHAQTEDVMAEVVALAAGIGGFLAGAQAGA